MEIYQIPNTQNERSNKLIVGSLYETKCATRNSVLELEHLINHDCVFTYSAIGSSTGGRFALLVTGGEGLP
jgi:hypothetical protein